MFFTLLNESYKLDATEKLHALRISAYPHMEKSGQSEIVRDYKKMSCDILEMLEETYDYSGIEKLKKSLNK